VVIVLDIFAFRSAIKHKLETIFYTIIEQNISKEIITPEALPDVKELNTYMYAKPHRDSCPISKKKI
jgi:hypothetical protein